jgi:hypothetical protein
LGSFACAAKEELMFSERTFLVGMALLASACGRNKTPAAAAVLNSGSSALNGVEEFDDQVPGRRKAMGPFSDWSTPVWLGSAEKPAPDGSRVNSPFDDTHPGISPDGRSLYITSTRPGGSFRGENLWVSRRASLDAPWALPEVIPPPLNNATGNAGVPNLTPDGHRVFFNSGRSPICGGKGPIGETADLWVSHRKHKHDDFGWEAPVNLGCAPTGPNFLVEENCAPTYFEDKETGITTLYFCTLNRPDGLGDYDIFASTLRADGSFGPGVLVRELSSPQRDTRTAIRRDGLEFFITSNRPGGPLAGLHIWVSTRATTRDPWSTPVQLPSPVNVAGARDAAPTLSLDGRTMYFSSTRAGGSRKEPGSPRRDLWVTTRTRLDEEDDEED